MDIPVGLWIGFAVAVLAFLALDLWVHRGDEPISFKGAWIWSGVWILVAIGFGGVVWLVAGQRAGLDYITAWAMEKSLSLDHLFIWLVVFRQLGVPQEKQRRVLFWGIIGAFAFRGALIFAGVRLVQAFDWVLYVLAGFLVLSSIRLAVQEESPERVLNFLDRHVPMTKDLHGNKMIVRKRGGRGWEATPLLAGLIGIELVDMLFAIDSIPAVFSVSTNEFIVYSSNAFALLGLRALYLVASKAFHRMRYLRYGLAGVLFLAGVKLALHKLVDIPPWVSLAVILALVGGTMIASEIHRKRHPEQYEDEEEDEEKGEDEEGGDAQKGEGEEKETRREDAS